MRLSVAVGVLEAGWPWPESMYGWRFSNVESRAVGVEAMDDPMTQGAGGFLPVGLSREAHETGAPVPDEAMEVLRVRLGNRVRFGEPLARYTSLRVGGPADVFVRAESVEDIRLVLRFSAAYSLPVFVLGAGTNLLVSDQGVRGSVLKLGRGFEYTNWKATEGGALVAAGAGIKIARIARRTAEAGFGGLVFAEGIPGTIGGAVLMNAGAYGGEMGAVVHAVSGVSADGSHVHFGSDALQFGYRHVALPRDFIVTEVTIRLKREPIEALRTAMVDVRSRRERAQPQRCPNAGSMFKNPPGEHAGRLIEAADLKGVRLGQVQISDRHANFFLNLGGARGSEVKGLMDLVQRVVWERFQIWLEPEVRLVGQW
jgi:UDP-N-acetylmuramate dehydrogenase